MDAYVVQKGTMKRKKILHGEVLRTDLKNMSKRSKLFERETEFLVLNEKAFHQK